MLDKHVLLYYRVICELTFFVLRRSSNHARIPQITRSDSSNHARILQITLVFPQITPKKKKLHYVCLYVERNTFFMCLFSKTTHNKTLLAHANRFLIIVELMIMLYYWGTFDDDDVLHSKVQYSM